MTWIPPAGQHKLGSLPVLVSRPQTPDVDSSRASGYVEVIDGLIKLVFKVSRPRPLLTLRRLGAFCSLS